MPGSNGSFGRRWAKTPAPSPPCRRPRPGPWKVGRPGHAVGPRAHRPASEARDGSGLGGHAGTRHALDRGLHGGHAPLAMAATNGGQTHRGFAWRHRLSTGRVMRVIRMKDVANSNEFPRAAEFGIARFVAQFP